MDIRNSFRPALVLFVALTLVTGVAYPLLIYGVGRSMPATADGSLIERGGVIVGSRLIGQPAAGAGHFWSRPSATGPMPDNASASSGSNQGPLNPALGAAVRGRIEALKAADKAAGVINDGPVPIDLVTTSASGLDPHISPAGARFQAARVASISGIAPDRVAALIDEHTDSPQFGFLGMPRVNVLTLNLALDDEAARRRAQ